MAPVVHTGSGRMRGMHEEGVLAFRGIPYAQPPIGPLRFRPPQKSVAGSGVREALTYGPAAMQVGNPMAAQTGAVPLEMSEDCLSLNVWTPAADGARRPVLVWLHGGAAVVGTGSRPLYNGARLAARGNVVVVTLNYRLGLFGFLARALVRYRRRPGIPPSSHAPSRAARRPHAADLRLPLRLALAGEGGPIRCGPYDGDPVRLRPAR